MTRPPPRLLLVALLVLLLTIALYFLVHGVRQPLLAPAPSHRPSMYPTVRARVPRPLMASAAVDFCLNGTLPATGPANAYTLPVSQRDQLQGALTTYHVVRLQAGDYRGSRGSITLSSNQELFGNPNWGDSVTSAVPPITVAPGTTNAIVDNVGTTQLTFPASSRVTSQNCFEHLRNPHGDPSYIVASGATLDSNIFLGDVAPILADDSSGGAMTNNRFIGSKAGQSAQQALVMKGDASSSSDNNVFLWYNRITGGGNSFYLSNQKNFALIGLDAETWNNNGTATQPALITTGPMGTLRGMGLVGSQDNLPASYNTPVYDFGANEVDLYNSGLQSLVNPGLIYERTNQRSGWIDSLSYDTTDKARGAMRFGALAENTADPTVNGQSLTSASLSTAQQAALRQMYVNPQRPGQPWEQPTFAAVPDPAGPNWATLCGTQDDTTAIQNAINSQGLVNLANVTTSNGNLGGTPVPGNGGARYFCISAPLLLGESQGLEGAGEGSTVIIAKSNAIDMIKGRSTFAGPGCTNVHITLADLTLEGGYNGIDWDSSNGSNRAMWSNDIISHVTFRNMANAGILLDGSCAIDGNFWDFDNFVGNNTAVEERSSWDGVSDNGISYMDKTVYFHNEFVGNSLGWGWIPAQRANNDNACISCLFQGNTQGALYIEYASNTGLYASSFINNGSNPNLVSTDYKTNLVGDIFEADQNGTGAMLGGNALTCEGCTFKRGTSTTATIFGSPAQAALINSTSVDMPVGTLPNGLLLNSAMGADPSLNQQGVSLQGGSATTFLSGTPSPVPQLLWGSAFAFPSANATPTPRPTDAPTSPSTATAAPTALKDQRERRPPHPLLPRLSRRRHGARSGAPP